MGLMLKALQNDLTAVDDKTFKWSLKAPYPKLLYALAKNNSPCGFIMPERIAQTDPFKQITEYVGSGPMKFAKAEWVPGAKAVFEKFTDYVPRQEKASWLAGGKQILVDRVEWVVIPDPATAAAALQNGKGDIAAAKKLLAESGYAGEPVICVVAQDQPITKAQGDVTADLLKQIGMNVDFVATDWGTVGTRRAQKTPPGQGGWNMFHTWHAGADCINPAAYTAIRANGDKAWFGWPDIPIVEKEITAWFEAKTPEEEKAAANRLNKAALDEVVYAPTGFFLGYTAWRKTISGIAKGPLPFFWGVSKTA